MLFNRIDSTVCALATSPGSSIGIIRISGGKSFNIASIVCGVKDFDHMKARLVTIKKNGVIIEKCLLLAFKAPKSFTGEDVIEFHVHGSMENSQEVLSLIISCGAIPALKGEFTFRAVMNGKMDVSEAIALNTLISSSNPIATKLSRKAAFEERSIKKFSALFAEWEHFFSLSTAIVDFPDQVEKEMSLKELGELILKTEFQVSSILKNSAMLNKTLNFSLMITGKPNVGKSSLFNMLLQKDRSIVSDIAGTTRDYINDSFFIKGFPVDIIDSAGIHDCNSDIEKTGVVKSRNLLSTADLLLVVLDSSMKIDHEDLKIVSETSIYPRIFVLNKNDKRKSDFDFNEVGESVSVSCKNEEGIDDLIDVIYGRIKKFFPDFSESVFFNRWQKDVADEILNSLDDLKTYINSDQIEIINILIKDIFINIKNLSGDLSAYSVYDKIFSDFCLGK